MEPTADNSHLFEESAPKSSLVIKLGALACALTLTVSLLLGYFFLRKRQNERIRAEQQAQLAADRPAVPKAHIRENEARLKGTEALISGTIGNISGEQLAGLILEVELRKRVGGGAVIREIKVTPSDLNPGEEGRYSFTIISKEWSSSTIRRLRTTMSQAEIAFKSSLGEKRPTERLPPETKVIIVPRPKPKGEEFINTPDTSITVK